MCYFKKAICNSTPKSASFIVWFLKFLIQCIKSLYIEGQKKTSFSNYFTVLKVGRGHKMIKRTLRTTNFTSTLCVWKGKSSISVQFFTTTNLPTCEKFVNISIFFYPWGAIEKLFENSKTIKTLGLRPRAFQQFSRVWNPSFIKSTSSH